MTITVGPSVDAIFVDPADLLGMVPVGLGSGPPSPQLSGFGGLPNIITSATGVPLPTIPSAADIAAALEQLQLPSPSPAISEGVGVPGPLSDVIPGPSPASTAGPVAVPTPLPTRPPIVISPVETNPIFLPAPPAPRPTQTAAPAPPATTSNPIGDVPVTINSGVISDSGPFGTGFQLPDLGIPGPGVFTSTDIFGAVGSVLEAGVNLAGTFGVGPAAPQPIAPLALGGLPGGTTTIPTAEGGTTTITPMTVEGSGMTCAPRRVLPQCVTGAEWIALGQPGGYELYGADANGQLLAKKRGRRRRRGLTAGEKDDITFLSSGAVKNTANVNAYLAGRRR